MTYRKQARELNLDDLRRENEKLRDENSDLRKRLSFRESTSNLWDGFRGFFNHDTMFCAFCVLGFLTCICLLASVPIGHFRNQKTERAKDWRDDNEPSAAVSCPIFFGECMYRLPDGQAFDLDCSMDRCVRVRVGR